MRNGKNKPPAEQGDANEPSPSMREPLAKLEQRIEELSQENEKRVLEAKISVGESRVTNLLILFGLLGIIYPVWMTNRNADKVNEAIKDMEVRFKELAGEYLREPNMVCEVDGVPLSGRTLIVGPNRNASQSFVIRNAGDASSGTVYVSLYLKETPAELGSLAKCVSDSGSEDLSMQPVPSDDTRFHVRYILMRNSVFQPKRECILYLSYSAKAAAAIDVEVPAMFKVHYGGPEPLVVPFTVKMVPGKP
ncbi:MAG: hypothetical protein ABFE13_14875 [Phycisphaerales bacterium]